MVDAFGYPKAEADLAEYRARYGLPPCTKANGCFKKLNQQGQELKFPEEEPGWDVEQALDLDMVSAACPSCHVILVEATDETPYPNDLAESVNTAVNAGATEVSNSYGLPEEVCGSFFECSRFASDYSHPGVFISASSGDHGYDNEYSALLRRIAAVSGRPPDVVGDRRHEPLQSRKRARLVRAGVERTGPRHGHR